MKDAVAVTPSRARLVRVLRATGIVTALGAVGGAIGGVALGAALWIEATFRTDLLGTGVEALRALGLVVLTAATCGAVYGLVLGPLYAWTLLRRVPLWRAIMEPAAVAAFTAGIMFSFDMSGEAVFVAPVCTSAVAALRRRAATARQQLTAR